MTRLVRWAFVVVLASQAVASMVSNPSPHNRLVCALEIAGCVLLLIPRAALAGAGLLVTLFVVVAFVHGGFTAFWLAYPTLLVLLIAKGT